MRPAVLRSTLFATALALVVGSTALAAPPTRDVIPINDHFTVDPGPGPSFNPCSQPLTVDQVGTLYITDYVDQAGILHRELQRTPQLYITITGPNGNSLTGLSPASSHGTFDFSTNTLTVVFTGQQYRFTPPGGGPVFATAGNETLVIDLNTGTFTDSFNGGERIVNVAAYCSYLGAN